MKLWPAAWSKVFLYRCFKVFKMPFKEQNSKIFAPPAGRLRPARPEFWPHGSVSAVGKSTPNQFTVQKNRDLELSVSIDYLVFPDPTIRLD